MSIFQIIIFFFLCLLIIGPTATATAAAAAAGVGVGGAEEQEAAECMPTSCSKHHHHGPQIRFPFRLKGRQPKHCGYPHPAFDLSCSTTPHSIYPVLELPFSVNVSVTEIDYKSQTLHISDPDDCFPRQFQNLNLSASPFQFVVTDYYYSSYYNEVTFINCSGTKQYYGVPIACLSDHSHQVYATWSDSSPRLSCIKMYNMSIPVKNDYYSSGDVKFDVLRLNWTKPTCGKCEAQGKYCRLMKNNNSNQTKCFDKPKQSNTSKLGWWFEKLMRS